MLSLLSAVLLVTLTLAPPGPEPRGRSRRAARAERIETMLTDPARRVRALDPTLATFVADGVRRSYTFGRLLEAIEEMDLIVYIVPNAQMPLSLAGRLMVVPAAHEQRYVRIEVAPHGTAEETIATIAHELQHAMEVAMAPDVRDDEGLAALYKRIGHGTGGNHSYDTTAARDIGRTVRSELG
jgi:hypothetical protein